MRAARAARMFFPNLSKQIIVFLRCRCRCFGQLLLTSGMHPVFLQVEGITLLTVQVVMLQVKWISWMTGVTMPTIPPEMNFSDIIIPTMDLVRGSFVLEMLLINNKKVRYISKDKRSL